MHIPGAEFDRYFSNSQVSEAAGHNRVTPGPRTILFIVNAAWFFLSHRLPLARAAREAGYDVHLLAAISDLSEQQALEREGIVVHHARITRAGLNPIAELRFLLQTMRLMGALSPTLVHNVTVKPVLYGTLAARVLGVPGIINAISGLGYAFSDKSRWMLAGALRVAYRLLLSSSRVHVIFQNDDDAHEFMSAHLVRPNQCTLILGSGVDLTQFRPASEEPSNSPLIVLPARMLRDKGVLDFAAAARLLSARGVHTRLALAGPLDSSNPAALSRNDLAELTAESPVQWLGAVEDMPGLYRRAHIVCLPSYREGLPKSLIEACAAGRPIVTTDVPGCRAVVTHEVNGLLVPPRNPEALADALERLVHDAALRERFGRAGRARAEREFALGYIVEQTLKVYERVLGRN
jgi:glycosyltransferase involved in cell wall biosynthesis